MSVIKRDGTKVIFDSSKIMAAITKANSRSNEMTEEEIAKIVESVVIKCEKIDDIDVEQIQDIVEKTLLASRFKATAKQYILYRDQRTRIRQGKLKLFKEIYEMVEGKNEYWNKENSNKDSHVVTTQRDYLAGITSTEISKATLLPDDVRIANEAGIIHEHDLDYMAQKALHNCCLINLDDILQNGTIINGVRIDPQNKLLTAATVATQVITSVASSQYGGTTITLAHLAPFVRKSFFRYYKEGLKFISEIPDIDNYLSTFKLTANTKINAEDFKRERKVFNYAFTMLKKEIKDSVQTFNYQINSMSTTNGQAPFLSVCMWIDENKEFEYENSLLIEEFLNQRILGMKNEKGIYITPAFPKLLYVLDENNISENSKYWELTKLAAKCTAKRMVPDYISAKKMREYKVSAAYGTHDVYPCMGKRKLQLM